MSHKDAPTERERDTKNPARLVLDAIRDTTPALYVNVASRPMVEIPFDSAPEHRESWSIDSSRVIAELAAFAYRLPVPLVLRDQEVSQIMRVLKGLAWGTRKKPTSVNEAFDEAPLMEALYTLLADESENGKFNGTVSDLQQKLAAIARNLGFREQPWPHGPPQFSKRLADLSRQGVLAKFGVTFDRDENARPRSVTLCYRPDDDGAASPASEHRRNQNAPIPEDLASADGCDGAAFSIFDELLTPSISTKEN